MCNRNVLLLSLIVIGYLKGIRTETNCKSNFVNTIMCDLIDKETDPCDDFYRFACGKYSDEQEKARKYYNTIDFSLQERNQQFLINHFHNPARHPNYIENKFELDLLSDLFKSCLDRDTLGVQPLLQLIDDFGGWPVLRGEDWNETNWVGLNISKELLIEAADIASIINIVYDKYEEDKRLTLELPTFVVNTNTLKDNGDIYKHLMANTAIKLGAYPPIAERDMEEVISFVMKLVITNRTLIKSRLTIAEMELEFPTLQNFIRPFIEPDVKYILLPWKYYKGLELTLKNTTIRTIANYLIWRVVVAAAPYVSRDFEEFIQDGIDNANSIDNPWLSQKERNRDIDCFDHVNALLRVAIDAVFFKEYENLTDEVESAVNQMEARIRLELIQMVRKFVWIEKDLKVKAIKKLSTIAISFGRRDKNLAWEELLDSNLTLQSDKFLQNFRTIKKYHRSHRPYAQVPTWEVGAGYLIKQNTIHVGPGILQRPYYSIKFPSYKQYGGLGFGIGHELVHAIDVCKYIVFSFGYLEMSLNVAYEEYNKKLNCLKLQYSAMEIETGDELNGRVTNTEDFADVIGVKAAYNAYLKLTEKNEPLPGLWNYTHRQLFWIAVAQNWCSYIHPYIYSTEIGKSRHSPNPFRVFGMIKNVPDFSNDFNCPPNSTMYFRKNETCEFW